ncbi:DUF6603 domain-containing protein [Galbibacter sp. BG1]
MAKTDFQETVFKSTEDFFRPLLVLKSDEDIIAFFQFMGWEMEEVLGDNAEDFLNNIRAIITSVEQITDLVTDSSDIEDSFQEYINEIKALIEAIVDLPNTAPNIDAEILKTIPEDLLNFLFIIFLSKKYPNITSVLEILTIIRKDQESHEIEDGQLIKTNNVLPKINWSVISELFSDPVTLFEDYYWPDGFTNLDVTNEVANRLFPPIANLLDSFGFVSMLGRGVGPMELDEEMEKRLEGYLSASKRFSIGDDSGEEAELGLTLGLVAENEGGPGVVLMPFGKLKIEEIISNWLLLLNTKSAIGELIFTRNGVDFFENPDDDFSIELVLAKLPKEDDSVGLRIGNQESSNFSIQNFYIRGELTANSHALIYGIYILLENAKLKILGGDGDGFLSTILGDGLTAEFDLEIGYSNKNGFHFKGSGGLEISLPVHIDLTAIEVEGINIAIKPDAREIPIELGANFKTNLGPLVATIENTGLKSTFSFPSDNSGNLGPINYAAGFKPPNGVGLSIDSGVIKGGGFLSFDTDKGEYAGALELTFSEIISLKAIGVINTKMPDGSDGFSLIVIITAEFGAGIQLGFGFTLLGVGGLLGLNRTMKLNTLADGVRTGAVNGIMFPTNIIENAPRIISDLKNFFPIQQDKFLIGPMAKLGWGTPTLMSISLGIIIEIPGNIAILGVLKIALPTEEAALLVLQANFIGAIEFDKERLWFFASLYDSRVLFITLEGEMGILVNWGSESNFLSSVGGFHPAFNPPRLPFPSPVRISMNLLNKSNAKIRVMGYFAVTSNTAQFGARAELYFGFSALKAEGHIAFDALFQFSPFHMVIQYSSSLSVKVFGAGVFSLRVKMTLEGPTPWKAHGTGSISLLFWDVDVDIDVTWGDSENTTLPPISIMPLVVAEYEKQENWKALIPANSNLLVSLRKIDNIEELVLHPVGSLQLSQRAIPLNLTLDKLGSQKPDDANRFTLKPSGSDLSKIKTLEEKFAIAQFKDLKDAEKLSSPSYQYIEGGLELSVSGEQFKTGKTVKRYIRYELVTIDSNYKRKAEKFFEFLQSLFGHFLGGNTVAKADISHRTALKSQPFSEKIYIQEPGFAVANMMNNKIYSPASQFSSQAQAKEFMNTQISEHPELSGQLHVLPTHELNSAA